MPRELDWRKRKQCSSPRKVVWGEQGCLGPSTHLESVRISGLLPCWKSFCFWCGLFVWVKPVFYNLFGHSSSQDNWNSYCFAWFCNTAVGIWVSAGNVITFMWLKIINCFCRKSLLQTLLLKKSWISWPGWWEGWRLRNPVALSQDSGWISSPRMKRRSMF